MLPFLNTFEEILKLNLIYIDILAQIDFFR